MKCKLCQGENTRLLFTSENIHGRHILSQEKFGLIICGECGVLYTDVDTKGEYYNTYYPEDYYGESLNPIFEGILNILKKLSFLARLRLIRRFSPQGNKILEIGCARGEFLSNLPDSFQKRGIEVNPKACDFIKVHHKDISVFQGKIEDAFSEKIEMFDIIVLWGVFEHIDNPVFFLETVTKILSPNGIVILEIPNRNSVGFRLTGKRWFHLDTPRHLFHYNLRSLKKTVEKLSFEVVFYSGSPIDYFHDLSVSLYQKYSSRFFLSKVLGYLLIIPVSALLRLFIAVFVPWLAEMNFYVLKKLKTSEVKNGKKVT